MKPPRAIVLFGPPGTGKTTFAKAVASRLGWPFVEVFPSRLAAGRRRAGARPARDVHRDRRARARGRVHRRGRGDRRRARRQAAVAAAGRDERAAEDHPRLPRARRAAARLRDELHPRARSGVPAPRALRLRHPDRRSRRRRARRDLAALHPGRASSSASTSTRWSGPATCSRRPTSSSRPARGRSGRSRSRSTARTGRSRRSSGPSTADYVAALSETRPDADEGDRRRVHRGHRDHRAPVSVYGSGSTSTPCPSPQTMKHGPRREFDSSSRCHRVSTRCTDAPHSWHGGEARETRSARFRSRSPVVFRWAGRAVRQGSERQCCHDSRAAVWTGRPVSSGPFVVRARLAGPGRRARYNSDRLHRILPSVAQALPPWPTSSTSARSRSSRPVPGASWNGRTSRSASSTAPASCSPSRTAARTTTVRSPRGASIPTHCTVECPRHGSLFDLRTGKPKTLPAYVPVDTFPVVVEDDIVKLEVD